MGMHVRDLKKKNRNYQKIIDKYESKAALRQYITGVFCLFFFLAMAGVFTWGAIVSKSDKTFLSVFASIIYYISLLCCCCLCDMKKEIKNDFKAAKEAEKEIKKLEH